MALKKENEDEAIGRSKGGLSTKIHAVCDALGTPPAFHLTAGQAHDLAGADVRLGGLKSGGHYSIDDFEAYLLEKHYLKGNCESNPKIYKNQAVLWSLLPNQPLYQFSRENFNIDHGITLISPNKKYCEFFAFASDKQHPDVAHFYVNNFDFLQKFAGYFATSASELIKMGEKNKIYLPFHTKTISSIKKISSMTEILSSQVSNTIQHPKLTMRQTECAIYLLKGMSASKIAKKLNISQRTVETHFEHLKSKLNCHNKTELILILSRILD